MKGKCYIFSAFKKRNKVCLVYSECKLQRDRHFLSILKLKCQKQPSTTETTTETTNKVPLMFLDIKVLTERKQLHFWTLSTNKQGTVYVLSV